MEQKKSPRKDYRRQSPQYFLIGLIVALSTTLVAFEYRSPLVNHIDFTEAEGVFVLPDDLPPVTLQDPKTPPPPPPAPVPPVPTADPVAEPMVLPLPEPVKPDPDFTLVIEPYEPEPLVKELAPFKIVEEMPEYPGKEEALYAYLGNNVKYPPYCLDNGIEAKLYVQFIVNKDGSISDVEVLNPQGYGFDEEAKRVISAMPNWKPGKQRGQKVRVYYMIPINFALK